MSGGKPEGEIDQVQDCI